MFFQARHPVRPTTVLLRFLILMALLSPSCSSRADPGPKLTQEWIQKAVQNGTQNWSKNNHIFEQVLKQCWSPK